MPSQSQSLKTNWCYGCADRVGVRKFRELTASGICQDCDSALKRKDPIAHSKLVPILSGKAEQVVQPDHIKRRIQNSTEYREKCFQRQLLFEQQEKELIAVFEEIQEENRGVWWRKIAAERLIWNDSLIKEVIKRVRRYKELKPTPMTEVVLKFVTSDYQSARQILTKLPTAKVDWVHISLERLAKSGRITRLYNKPYETKYRLPKAESD
jgi:hypothetical protein